MSTVQAQIEMIQVTEIIVSNRGRTEMGEIGELCESIQKFGLLNPIIVDSNLNLHCGERRLKAFQQLKRQFIPCRFLNDLTETEKLEVELDENIRRKQLTWQEELLLREKLTRKWQELQPQLTLAEIATKLNMDDISHKIDLFLAKSCKEKPELLEEKEKTAALRKAREVKDIALRSLIVQASGKVQQLSPPVTQEQDETELVQKQDTVFKSGSVTLYNADCLTILNQLQTDSVDCILTDPPYGVDFENNSDFTGWLNTFKDDHEFVFTRLLPPILSELLRILKPDGHFYFFYAMIHHQRFLELIKATGFKPQYVPLIWNKGSVGGLKERYRMDYEPVLFGGKDNARRLAQPASTTYICQNPSNKLHPAEKPVDLLSYYISQSTIEGEIVLDPFLGSGSTMLAAQQLNRQGIGIEKEKQWFDVAVNRFL